METRKTRHFRPTDSEQTPTVISTARTRRIKTPNPELAELIRLANLATHEIDLPDPPLDPRSDSEWLKSLPDRVRLELLEHKEQPEKWSSRVPPPDKTIVKTVWGAFAPVFAMIDHYNLILASRKVLQAIVNKDLKPVRVPMTAWFRLHKDKKTAELALDEESMPPVVGQIVKALKDADVSYLKRCPICGNYFYGRREASVVCEPKSKCAATYAKRQERKNKKLREQKRAQTARKR
jgi:hypothetical protein